MIGELTLEKNSVLSLSQICFVQTACHCLLFLKENELNYCWPSQLRTEGSSQCSSTLVLITRKLSSVPYHRRRPAASPSLPFSHRTMVSSHSFQNLAFWVRMLMIILLTACYRSFNWDWITTRWGCSHCHFQFDQLFGTRQVADLSSTGIFLSWRNTCHFPE